MTQRTRAKTASPKLGNSAENPFVSGDKRNARDSRIIPFVFSKQLRNVGRFRRPVALPVHVPRTENALFAAVSETHKTHCAFRIKNAPCFFAHLKVDKMSRELRTSGLVFSRTTFAPERHIDRRTLKRIRRRFCAEPDGFFRGKKTRT